jgi:hypothetical protein
MKHRYLTIWLTYCNFNGIASLFLCSFFLQQEFTISGFECNFVSKVLSFFGKDFFHFTSLSTLASMQFTFQCDKDRKDIAAGTALLLLFSDMEFVFFEEEREQKNCFLEGMERDLFFFRFENLLFFSFFLFFSFNFFLFVDRSILFVSCLLSFWELFRCGLYIGQRRL